MKEVRDLIRVLTRERGITVFLSSHLLNEVEQVATRMAIINNGTMIVQGSVEELLKAQANRLVLHVQPVETAAAVIGRIAPNVSLQITHNTISLSVDTAMIPAMITAIAAEGCSIFSVEPKHSLEEYFLTVTETN